LPSAPPELIRAAFKCLATIFHPDKPGGDDERMKAINRAYEKLAAAA
jgi:curved DNA-binding protein CbpA